MQRAALEEVLLVGLAWRSQGYGMDKGVMGFTNLPGALGPRPATCSRPISDERRPACAQAGDGDGSPGLSRPSSPGAAHGPGDPAELLLSTGGISPDPASVAELREKPGLDRPILVQYAAFGGCCAATSAPRWSTTILVLSEIARGCRTLSDRAEPCSPSSSGGRPGLCRARPRRTI